METMETQAMESTEEAMPIAIPNENEIPEGILKKINETQSTAEAVTWEEAVG